MPNDEYMAKFLVLGIVFSLFILSMGISFLLKLGKIKKEEDHMQSTERRKEKSGWKRAWDLFWGNCQVCGKTATHLGDDRRNEGGMLSVCAGCGKDFKNLHEIKQSTFYFANQI